jgi:DNA (cytosine-5)-methyltransferase 1
VGPGWVFLENVQNHLNLGFRTVREELQEMGYTAEAGLFTASEVGATHERKRLFVLAHANRRSSKAGANRTRRKKRADAGGCGKGPVVADANVAGCGTVRLSKSQYDNTKSSIKDVADTYSQGLSEPKQSSQPGTKKFEQQAGPTTTKFYGTQLPTSPPGPNQHEEWERILSIDPTLEPALCGMDDVMAHRVDRIRIAGNGVVPLEAANAFITLLGAMESQSCLK